MDREKAETLYNKILDNCKNSTIYNSDLEEETIEFYKNYPEVFQKTKRNIITDFQNQKEKIVNEIMQDE